MTDRYDPVRAELPAVLPAITRIEAERAAKRLYAKFAPPGRARRLYDGVRRCWISGVATPLKPAVRIDNGNRRESWNGWPRLIHDVSHDVFSAFYPGKRDHDPLHVYYETEIAKYVAESGWLEGSLKPKVKPKAKPTLADKHAAEYARNEAAIKRWETKAKRAANALKKLRRRQRRIFRIGVDLSQ